MIEPLIKLFELIKKNFKLLVRAKVSALVIFIGPLLLVTLLGLAYSQSGAFTLTASVYSDSYSELSESLIAKMMNQNFRIVREQSIQHCVGSLKRGESQACIVFPGGMSVEKGASNEITFYVDYSQLNLVWLMLDVMSARVSERSEEITRELTTDILSRMWFIEEKIKAGQSSAAAMKTEGTALKESSSNMRTGFKRLDISVDFSGLNITGTKNLTESINSVLSDMKDRASNVSNAVSSKLGSIESSAESIGSMVNDSSVLDEVDDIDKAVDDVQEAVEDLVESTYDDVSNASAGIALIIKSLNDISEKVSNTKTKINSVKKERDDLLPEFDSLASSIDAINADIGSLQGVLDEALQKITEVKGRSVESIAAAITTKIEPVATQKTHFNSLFPTLLVLVIMITGILLSSTLTAVDKKSKAFLRNNFTPTSYVVFNLSTYLTSLMVLFIQLILFVSVSAFFFETEVLASIWLLLLLVFLTCTVFICIGMFVGFLFKTEETVTLASITLATVFLLFSSAVIPLESLPAYLKEIALFNPFVISEVAFRQTLIFQLGFSEVMKSIGLLAAYAVGIFALMILAQNALRKLSFMHFNRLHFKAAFIRRKEGSAKLASPGSLKNDSVKKDAAKKKDVKDINELAVRK